MDTSTWYVIFIDTAVGYEDFLEEGYDTFVFETHGQLGKVLENYERQRQYGYFRIEKLDVEDLTSYSGVVPFSNEDATDLFFNKK